MPIIQPRLIVGPVDDPHEREADRAAEIVAGGGASGSRAGGFDLAHGLSRLVRRVGKSEPPKHRDDERKDEDDKKKVVQKRAVAAGPSTVPAGIATGINQAMTSGGTPLPTSVRATFEHRFGHDLAGVRVHTDGLAAEATTALGAKAFTIGEHVFFGAGEYQPGSRLGQWLIAHELAHVVQQAPPGQVRRRPIITWEIAGTRFYRTRNGDDIELPEDMTAQEVAQLEDDAIAAESRLAELPPPKPVPEVRKPSPKPAVPKAAKGRPRRRRGKVVAPPKLAEAAAALLKAVGRGKAAAYLAAKGAPVFAQGAAKLSRLRAHEQTHDDGGEKLRKSEDAVVIPSSEEQSASNAVQVAQVDDRQVPTVDETKGKSTLERSLKANVPRTVGELDNFKRDEKAGHTSAAVLVVVQGDKDSVIGTFGDVRATPPPIPSTKDEADLPPPEAAPGTPAMHLGRGAIAPLLKEHTDVSDYTKQADTRLKDEGVTQEQLDMVDSGDLAEANKEKKRMVVQAATEPLAVQKMAEDERTRVDKDLQAEEHAGRAAIAGRRRGALATTGHKQKDTKRDLEKKRDDVAKEINSRYKAVQDHVKGRLDELDLTSMKRFDQGQGEASRAFENDVNRELQAYKADRYSGWFGWARKAKDWIRGLDKLPKVKEIFERNRDAFQQRISKLVETITADNQRVIRECHDELLAARTKIDEYVAGLEPGLQDIGKKSAREMQEKLDLLDKDVSNKEQELQNKLKDKQTAAIRAIDEKIEKMKESMSGALAKVGRLLLKAAKKFFTWALEKFGLSLSTIESIIDKGTAVLKAIFTGPIGFVKNLIAAAKLGLANFGKNFVSHLKDALFEWLTGSLPGIVLPESWTVKGIVSVLLQIVGISWANLKARLLLLIPAPAVEALQTTFTLVRTLVVDGPMAAWEQIKEMGEELKKAFVSAITDWLKWKVVEEAVKTIAAIFVPGAGIVRAIVGIYDTIVFFIQKARDIMQMVGDFLGSVADIAAGKIGSAADALERGLARGLKLVIVFLAKLLRLDGIAARIRTALEAIRNKVNAVLDKVASWVVGLAKKAGKLGKDGAAEPARDKKWTTAVAGVDADIEKMTPEEKTQEGIAKRLAGWKKAWQFTELTVSTVDGQVDIEGAMSPGETVAKFSPAAGTPPVYGSLTNTYGTSVAVAQLGLKPTGGSPASQSLTSDGWERLIKRRNDRTGGSSYFVKGHLLNNHLGGPGTIWDNLTPLTQEGNNRDADSMYHAFEKKVKAAVLDEKRTVTDFKVVAIFGAPSRKAEIAEIDAKLNTSLSKAKRTEYELIRDVIVEEQRIATRVDCKAKLGKSKSAAAETLSLSVDNSFQTVTWQKYRVAA